MSQNILTFQKSSKIITRRQFVRAGFAAALLCAAPWPAWARQLLDNSPERSLSLYNTHTGENLCKVVYWQQGCYLDDSLKNINHLLRDHRTNEIIRIDAGTLDMMFALREKFTIGKTFEIISGYRSPESNQLLRKTSSGVAKASYHTLGKAVDLRLPGVPLKTLRNAALQLKRGGVGYYPKSDFIHIDTGPIRAW